MPIRLILFGSPTIEYDGESSVLPFERRNQLLVFLALKRAWVGRAELAAMLWPEHETKLAYSNLRKTLFRLQSLPWGSAIEAEAGALRFEADTDAFAFESALREGRLVEALPLYRGELLAGFDYLQEAWSSWLGFERDRLRVAWRDAALKRLDADIDAAEGIDLSARLLDLDALDEAALSAHMSWLARGGQSARGRGAYRTFVQRLSEELGLTPGAELKALHDSLASAVRVPLPTVAATPEAGFVGRTVELRWIASHLTQDDCRVLGVIGPGGVGKTRLAQRAVQELAPGFRDGAAFVPLEDVASASELGGRLARELGVSLTGSEEPLGQVIARLRERHLLLVLDSFEHLAADASILERLVQGSAHLKLIVTSRVRPEMPMKWLLSLEGLPCPEIEDEDRVEAFDAGRLFVQAAQRVEPALIPAVEAASIVDICRQVEGLPLALELAASWTRVLSCDAIAADLRRGTELLQGADGTQPARHASMQVVFDQSWRLLGPIEQDALSRLSVFRGGFSAEAARAVVAAPFPILGALVDKSLLRKSDARLFLHPVVQQLAALRLAGDARASTEEAHALFFHRLLKQLRRAVENGDRDALRQVEIDFENCRLAWRWSIAHASGGTLTHSAPALFYFCDHRGRFKEGLDLLREALESASARDDPKLNALLRSEVAHLEYRLDRLALAEATANGALVIAELTRDPGTQALALQVLGACCLRLGRLDEAKRFFQQAMQQALSASDLRKAGVMLHNEAVVERTRGRPDAALRLFVEAMARHKAVGDVSGEALCLMNMGLLLSERGELASAAAHFEAGLEICERHGLVSTKALVLTNFMELAVKRDDHLAAASYGRRALDIAEATGNRFLVAFLKLQFVRIALARGEIDAARSDLGTALEAAIALGRPSLLISGIASFAEVLAAQGEVECARRLLAFAAAHPSTTPSEREQIGARLAQWGPGSGEPAWPGLELDELAHRIVVETSIAHAPLIATLRGPR